MEGSLNVGRDLRERSNGAHASIVVDPVVAQAVRMVLHQVALLLVYVAEVLKLLVKVFKVQQVNVECPIDNIESMGCWVHMQQVLRMESVFLLSLVSSVPSIGSAESTMVSCMGMNLGFVGGRL